MTAAVVLARIGAAAALLAWALLILCLTVLAAGFTFDALTGAL